MKPKNKDRLFGSFLQNQSRSMTGYSSTTSTNSFEIFKEFMLHVGLLLKKNFTLQKRSLRTTLVQYWAPLMACYIIILLQRLESNISSGVLIETPIDTIGKIPKCFGNETHPDDCITVAYATVGPSEPWIESVMNYVAKANELDTEKDVYYLGEINPKEFGTYLNKNQNQTQIGVIFCTEEWKLENGITIPCRPESVTDKKVVFYSIVFNMTEFITSPIGDDYRIGQPKHPIASSLKLWLDNGILAYFSIDKEAKGDKYQELDPEDMLLPKIEATRQGFPKSHFRFFIGVDLVTFLGNTMFFLPYMIHFVVTLMDILKEKHHKLRQGLSVMGMSDSAYWVSWAITSFTANFVLTVTTSFTTYFCGFKFFTDTPIPVTFSLFLCLGMSLQALAFFVTTLCPNMTVGYVSTYSILLLFVMLNLILGDSVLSYLVFSITAPGWFAPIKFLLSFIPVFNYAAIYTHIAAKSGGHYDTNDHFWVQGPGFTYEDLWIPSTDENSEWYWVPSAMHFFRDIVLNILFYLLLTWYCDNVVSHNRGCEKSPLFFLQGWKWNLFNKYTSQKSYKKNSADFTDDLRDSNSDQKELPYQEHDQPLPQDGTGLRIIGLNKIYSKHTFGCFKKKEMHAVKDLCLEVNDGELLSILGHNGAGKTTLIGVLTGILKPSSGTARLCDYDIRHEMDDIRKIMGVCPQFDILWDELTADEHLHIYARLKGIPADNVSKEIETRLKEVNLLNVRHAQAGTFSGGMKRRLSMAIAFIGDPRIVFLDEPTTGMDPKNRRYIWELILNMKRNRIVVLTTHAMEEADVLSDRIAVMAAGSLKCVGTPLYLKNTFGDGYKLSLVVEKDDVEEIKSELLTIVSSAKFLDCSGGSIMVGVPLEKTEQLQGFFSIMEGNENSEQARRFRGKVKDWGLSHTTLEEVFMKVTRE